MARDSVCVGESDVSPFVIFCAVEIGESFLSLSCFTYLLTLHPNGWSARQILLGSWNQFYPEKGIDFSFLVQCGTIRAQCKSSTRACSLFMLLAPMQIRKKLTSHGYLAISGVLLAKSSNMNGWFGLECDGNCHPFSSLKRDLQTDSACKTSTHCRRFVLPRIAIRSKDCNELRFKSRWCGIMNSSRWIIL